MINEERSEHSWKYNSEEPTIWILHICGFLFVFFFAEETQTA